jgi:hypothetical protein
MECQEGSMSTRVLCSTALSLAPDRLLALSLPGRGNRPCRFGVETVVISGSGDFPLASAWYP